MNRIESPSLDRTRDAAERAAKPIRRALFMLICACVACRAGAEVQEQLDTTDYPVRGSPSVSLRQLLNDASPIRENGNVFHGYTKWTVDWRFRWHQDGNGSCRITTVTTRVAGNITLPRLVAGSAEQRQRFDPYLAALRKHEMGHYAFGRQAGQEIDAGILALPPMRNCATLESAANDFGRRVLDRHLASERQYDASTGHGRTQGAWLDR